MSVHVTWDYDGASKLSAHLSGLTAGWIYELFCDVGDGDDITATGSTATLRSNAIGISAGFVAGDTFIVAISTDEGRGSTDIRTPVEGAIFTFGTASGISDLNPGGWTATWDHTTGVVTANYTNPYPGEDVSLYEILDGGTADDPTGALTSQSLTHSFLYAQYGDFTVLQVDNTDTGNFNARALWWYLAGFDTVYEPTTVLAADFSATPRTGNPTLAVSFSDLSTAGDGGAITTWAWAFGDGGTSSSQNPSHNYTAQGVYDVTLTVTSPDGTSARTREGYVLVGLTAFFSASPTAGNPPLGVDFTDESTAGASGPITAWAWDFGDGHTSTSENPPHTYSNDGTYDVQLTVTGTAPDGTASHTRTAYISVSAPLVPSMNPGRRVGIAFDDGPLTPNPAWIYLDDETIFPSSFVSGYDTRNGRQTLISQTDTGTATVYVNDRAGLFDDRNDSSPYQGKLAGRQIKLQLWNPVTLRWEPQFRGIIDDYNYDIDPATDAHGNPINASVQLECVDIFDYLNGYGLTPGLDGQTPPAGMEDGVYYPQTTGGIQDRFIEILTDVNLDPSRYSIFQGNVNVIAVKYDPDESALTALRDAADAELPFIANIYVDRWGKFLFRGRYSRFDPDTVAAEPGVNWDFTRWPLGDGKAIESDPSRGQMRVLAYTRSRADLINAALSYPQGIKPEDMPNQVYADATSITNNGKHQAPPMSDLLTCEPTSSGNDKNTETFLFAKLLVENKKHPRVAITSLQLKAMRPEDPRAAATWGPICGADISHIVNVAVGYPGGTGLVGDSPSDDHYVEGRALTVRPLNEQFDYVECDLEVSPALWSMDANNVFPPLS